MPVLRLILASASPQRAALLAAAGIPFEARPATIAEQEDGEPEAVARANARAKAAQVAAWLCAEGAAPGTWVLGADTVAALASRCLGKPRDAAHARAILAALSGTTHEVISAVALAPAGPGEILLDSDRTRITMRTLRPAEIDAYVAGGECFGKAGAYAVQAQGDAFVARRDGAFDTVVGLPIACVRALLARAHFAPAAVPVFEQQDALHDQ